MGIELHEEHSNHKVQELASTQCQATHTGSIKRRAGLDVAASVQERPATDDKHVKPNIKPLAIDELEVGEGGLDDQIAC